MNYDMYTNEELIRMVDNDNNATDLERALAGRLDELSEEIRMQNAIIADFEAQKDDE